MKINRISSIISMFVAAVLITAHAQKEVTGLQLVAPEEIPDSGTFWLVKGPTGDSSPPMPCPPLGMNFLIYDLGGAQYLVDDGDFDYESHGKNRSSGFALYSGLPSPGDEESEGESLESEPDTRRNHEKFMYHNFSVIDTNLAAEFDTNLYSACASFPEDTNTAPVLQIAQYGTGAVIIKASHFDYSAETMRDFALLVCDKVETPTWKIIDFLGESDNQDGWLVQGLVPNWKVSDPMYFLVSDLVDDSPIFFRAIPYSGPIVELAGYQPYDVVSNIITLQGNIMDLSGVTNHRFSVTVDGLPSRYSLGTNNLITLETKYNPEGVVNIYLSALNNNAQICDPTNRPDNTKLFFDGSTTLPLEFENDTYLLWASDNCSIELGTNFFYFVTDKPQTITASIYNPSSGNVVATYGGYVPHAATISLEWNFTEADGTTPYSNDTYAVTFQTSNPTTLTFTNRIVRDGVRPGAGCYLTYQEEDPLDSMYGTTGNYLNQQADTWINGALKTLYQDLYKSLSITQYTPQQVGTNRNHADCTPLGPANVEWAEFMAPAMANPNYSDLTIAQAHGNGFYIGGGPYLLNKFSSYDLNAWILNYQPSKDWRLRKAAIWTCYSGSTPDETGDYSFPQACGIRPWTVQETSFIRKNCGIFFGGFLAQGGFGGTATTTAEVAASLDLAWVCGPNAYPGGCDPTYSIRFAGDNTRRRFNPEMDRAQPRLYGYSSMIYTTIYDDELLMLDTTHVKEGP